MKGAAAPGDTLTVRGIGGFADGVRLHFDGMEELNSGSNYLLFLKRVDWPTREGSDQDLLTPVAHRQGVFLKGTDSLKNAASVEITSVDEISLPD